MTPMETKAHGSAGENPPVRVGERYNRDQGVEFLLKTPMGELMALAHEARMRRVPRPEVTYVLDTNPNYTNICETQCRFCAFCRTPEHKEAYTLTPEQVAERTAEAAAKGATTVLLQGGHNPDIGIADWTAYIRAIRAACPDVHIHPFSPAEYVFMSEKERVPVREILETVKAEGVTTIPGGGAEILSERVRRIIAPNKPGSDAWLRVCEIAHELGFTTTATMMFGHVEKPWEVVEHLLKLRDLQDRTGGFSSFIPWSFKPGGTVLAKRVPQPAHPALYVRIIAVARLLLDNFPHVQSSWFSESVSAGQLGLLAGADDFGGVLVEENVLATTGHTPRTTPEEVREIIRAARFEPVQRDSFYRAVGAEETE